MTVAQRTTSGRAHDGVLQDVLTSRQILSEEEVEAFARHARDEGADLAQILEREGILSHDELLQVLENHYFCPAFDIRSVPYDASLLKLIPRRLAERHNVYPVAQNEDALTVAFARPDDETAADTITHWTMKRITRVVALRHELVTTIRRSYDRFSGEIKHASARRTPQPQAPATPKPRSSTTIAALIEKHDPVEIVDALVLEAVKLDATDVHVEPSKEGLDVRYRIDGILHRVAQLPRAVAPPVAARLKVMAQMDIAERRVPQDGRFTRLVNDITMDVRVSSLPAQYGEKIVLRLLRENVDLLNVENLHMPDEIRKVHQDMITSPLGFFVVVGPTGSGKTTTLYATLMELERESLNVVTLENPIEYSLEGITQVQINEPAGLTFAAGLESILRQDPDVVLVGEMRSAETADIACRAALTGHKVFSTLHTNNATQAVTRLVDMGVVPYLITATLRGVLAQRLVRKNCRSCIETYEANETEAAVLGQPQGTVLHRGMGCEECAGTGYRGRIALFEYFKMDESYHRLILDKASSYALQHAARKNGMKSLFDHARQAVLDGVTTVAEIQRTVLADEGKEQLCVGCKRVISVEFSVCPYCQYVIKEFCPRCNAQVDSGWEACANCGFAIERAWRRSYCSGCDAPLEEGWGQCPYCGRSNT